MAISRVLLIAACLALAVAAPARNQKDCVNANLLSVAGLNVYPATRQIQSSSVQALQDKTTVQVAQNFQVTYYSTFKVVTNQYAYALETYVLYQCGTAPPDPAQLGLPNGTKVLAVPLSAVSVQDTSVLNFMKLLGVLDRVSFVTPYAVEPCMQALAGGACNRTTALATADTVDGTFVGYSVNAANPRAIAFTATADPGPLNRAEYIKYVAAFFNREATANAAFNRIVASYAATKAVAASYLASTNASAPLVAWLIYQPEYNSASYKAPAQMILYFNPYRKQYTEDAGGRLHSLSQLNATYGNGVSVKAVGATLVLTDLPNTLPVLRAILKDVDVLVDESYYGGKNPSSITLDDFRTLYGLTDEAALTEMAFLRGQRLLRLDGSANPGGTTAWFEEAVARPDEVLQDLVLAIQPQALAASNAQPRLVRSMFAASPGRVVLSQAADCPLVQQTCGGSYSPICPAVYLDCKGKPTLATDQTPCAPVCGPSTAGSSSDSQGGAAGRAAAAPALVLALLVAALAAVMGLAL